MSEINVMDFVAAMNAKTEEVTQSNAERTRLLEELQASNKRNAELVDDLDKTLAALDVANSAVYSLGQELQAANGKLREANISKENLRELLAGF